MNIEKHLQLDEGQGANEKEPVIKVGDGVVASSDKVYYEVLEIYDNGTAKLKGARGKEVIKPLSELTKFETHPRPEQAGIKEGDAVRGPDGVLYEVLKVNRGVATVAIGIGEKTEFPVDQLIELDAFQRDYIQGVHEGRR